MQHTWNTYGILLGVHSIVRWLVVVAGVAAVGRAWSARFGGRQWTAGDTAVGRLFVAAMDVQLAIGALLYGFFSAVVRTAITNPGVAFQSHELRFWLVEHPIAMIAAVVLAHVGLAKAKRVGGMQGQRIASLLFAIAMLLVLAAIPWPALSYGRGLWPAR